MNGTDVEGQLCKYTEIALANYEVFVGNRERYVFDWSFCFNFQ